MRPDSNKTTFNVAAALGEKRGVRGFHSDEFARLLVPAHLSHEYEKNPERYVPALIVFSLSCLTPPGFIFRGHLFSLS